MLYVKSFYKENRVLSKVSVMSLAYIVFYYLSYDIPEVWSNASVLADILFQLSLAVVSSLIFYVFQVYIPNYKRKKVMHPTVQKKIRRIIELMETPFEEIVKTYLKKSKCIEELSDTDIKYIAQKYCPSDDTSVQVAFECRNLSNVECFQYCFKEIDNIIGELLFIYEPYLKDEQRDILVVIKESEFRKLFDNELTMLLDITGIQGNAVKDTFRNYINYYKFLKNVI